MYLWSVTIADADGDMAAVMGYPSPDDLLAPGLPLTLCPDQR